MEFDIVRIFRKHFFAEGNGAVEIALFCVKRNKLCQKIRRAGISGNCLFQLVISSSCAR